MRGEGDNYGVFAVGSNVGDYGRATSSGGAGIIGEGSPGPTGQDAGRFYGDVKVTGTSFIGEQIVTTTCSDATTCIATCPTDKKVLGGGCGTDGRIEINMWPKSDHEYKCWARGGGKYKITVNAICARVDN